ncbi:hypothetical protein Sjap_007916 [Stephania japonica]|uniref:Fe2OG dioxygenase domain-containing protein n=1 Tax=Stephania japonica TaxID=461633 RepID=A0AAP0JNM2_9MAGN
MALLLEEENIFDFVVKQGNGVKGMVDLGLSKVPDRYVQPSDERINKLEAKQHVILPIDLSELEGPRRNQVVKSIVKSAETIGFFQVVNHGLKIELLEKLKDAAHKFFNQPPEKKAIYLSGVSPSPLLVKYGTSFLPEKEEALEWKDYLSMIYTNDKDALEHWPKLCKEVALEYLKTSSEVGRRILEVLISELGVTYEDWMAEAYMGTKFVNMNFYPTCPNPELTVGVGRHSDMGTITVLLQDGIGGLYVKVEEDEDSGKRENGWRFHPSLGPWSSTLVILCRLDEKIGPLREVAANDGKARYKEFLFEEYKNNFFGNAHDGKKSLDFAKITTQLLFSFSFSFVMTIFIHEIDICHSCDGHRPPNPAISYI